MKTLQEMLSQRHDTVSTILEPIDMSKIMSTMTKLKIALSEISTRNAQLVMRNDQLRLQLSFMPPQMWNQIHDAKDNKPQYYRDQRNKPHYLIPERNTEFFFSPADPNDPRVSKLQRYTAVTSVTDLLIEGDETMKFVKAHSSVEDNCIHEDEEIAEEALGNTNVATDRTFVVPCPERHRPRLAGNATKRSHNTIVHTGHKTHPSKSRRIAPTVEPPPSNSTPQVASTFGDMPLQNRQVHKTSAYFTNVDGDETRVMEGDNSFSPIGRSKMAYDTSDTFAEDDEGR
jgi:hypothetical protein